MAEPSTGKIKMTPKQLEKLYKKAASYKKAGVLIVGNSGAGKTTLINACFGVKLGKVGCGRAVTQYVIPYFSDDFPLILYDTKGIETGVDPTDYKNSTLIWLDKAEVHLCLYVVNADAHRWLIYDSELSQIIQKKVPMIVVVNHCDKASASQTAKLRTAIEKDVPKDNIIYLAIPPDKLIYHPSNCPRCKAKAYYIPMMNKYNCVNPACAIAYDVPEKVVQRAEQLLNLKNASGAFQDGNSAEEPADDTGGLVELIPSDFDPSSDDEFGRLLRTADEILPGDVRMSFRIAVCDGTPKWRITASVGIIMSATAGAGVTGGMPVPFADMPVIIGIQVGMFFSLATAWGLKSKFTASKVKSLALAAVGSAGAFAAVAIGGSALASTLKLIPGVGSVVGSVINASVATTLTLTLGIVFTLGFYDIWRYGGSSLDEIEAKMRDAMRATKRILGRVKNGSGPRAIIDSEAELIDLRNSARVQN